MSVSYEVYSDHTGADSKLFFFLLEEVTFVSVAVEVTWVSCGGLVWWQLTYVSLERQTARCSNPTSRQVQIQPNLSPQLRCLLRQVFLNT